MKIVFLVLYISVIEVAVAVVSLNGRIFNGENALKGKYPFVVSVQYCEYGPFRCWHLCGGTILASTWILSAGHCYFGLPPLHFVVSAGSVNLLEKFPHRQIIRVTDIIFHPYYLENTETSTHDLALLKLQSPLLYSNNIQPAQLEAEYDFSREAAIVVGWGSTVKGQVIVSPILQEAEVIPLKYRTCRNFLVYFHGIWVLWRRINRRFTICTRNKFDKTGPCRGDSGGPLIRDGIVVGVATFNVVSCGMGLPTFYVNISPHLDWIDNYVTFGK